MHIKFTDGKEVQMEASKRKSWGHVVYGFVSYSSHTC